MSTGYPKFAFNLTSKYEFSSGWLNGFGFGGSVRASWQYRYFYYYANGVTPTGSGRTLFYQPNQAVLDGIFSYRHKFGRIVWSTQLNIYNLLNHYDIMLIPNENAGFAPSSTDATFNVQPRSFAWTNTLSF